MMTTWTGRKQRRSPSWRGHRAVPSRRRLSESERTANMQPSLSPICPSVAVIVLLV
ncbi:hypothetical protein JZ751_000004 [Albula glossodonta]|uniref:Uncharacterized protein n=1 Tax=Albula glossodonta TaxID=121402 RepID=A0A8T2PVB1_9TELE|nr:hypothetical protein JZ751_000004 [Albula glossodonta]